MIRTLILAMAAMVAISATATAAPVVLDASIPGSVTGPTAPRTSDQFYLSFDMDMISHTIGQDQWGNDVAAQLNMNWGATGGSHVGTYGTLNIAPFEVSHNGVYGEYDGIFQAMHNRPMTIGFGLDFIASQISFYIDDILYFTDTIAAMQSVPMDSLVDLTFDFSASGAHSGASLQVALDNFSLVSGTNAPGTNPPTNVSAPAGIAMLGLGLLAIGAMRRRQVSTPA